MTVKPTSKGISQSGDLQARKQQLIFRGDGLSLLTFGSPRSVYISWFFRSTNLGFIVRPFYKLSIRDQVSDRES